MAMKSLLYCLAAALLVGCASYDFKITQPPALARVVSSAPQRIATEHMTYHMQALENRLVVQIFNETAQLVQLLGEQSVIVDPHSTSHPLKSQAIAPHSFAKLILPPLRPQFERQGPGFNFGVGTSVSSYSPYAPYAPYSGYYPYAAYYPYSAFYPYYPRSAFYDYGPYQEPAQYMDIYEDSDNSYWDWDGEAPIRLSITYQFADGKKATDEFTIQKHKRD